MSKSDFPPAYDDDRAPLHGNMNGYPPPPPYGFGGGVPGQPSAPYPATAPPYPTPGAPYPGQGFPGQGFPGQDYPGQPYPGGYQAGPPGQGRPPTHMPMPPPVIPPTIPNDVLSSDEEGFAARGSNWDDLSVRHAFIRKVYMILSAQLLFTVAIICIFTFVEPVGKFVRENPALYWTSYAVYFVTHIVLVCCKGPRRKHPWNLILLFLFTLALSYMTGSISGFYETKAVFLSIGITAIVCIAVTIFCFQTKVDFTKCQGLFCVLGIVVFITGIITAIVLSFKYIYWLHMLYAAIGAIVFTLFLAYHTQLLIGNRKYSISPEEYVFGALTIYVDIIQIFLFLLQIIGSSKSSK